jgi:hypothetical protein
MQRRIDAPWNRPNFTPRLRRQEDFVAFTTSRDECHVKFATVECAAGANQI